MEKKLIVKVIVAVFVLSAFLIVGCAPSKVKMKRETVDWQQERAMAQRSLERFDDGLFYVYEWRPGITAAIVADLKDTERTIKSGVGWRKINTRQELEEAHKAGAPIKAKGAMRLYRIEGDDGEVWGYFFAPYNIWPYSMVDDKTIELGTIPEPKAPGA